MVAEAVTASLEGSWILDGWHYAGCIFLQPFFTTRTTKNKKWDLFGLAYICT